MHVATFDALAKERELNTVHRVYEAWLTEATENGITDDLTTNVGEELQDLRRNCDVVICTCSTLGALATSMNDSHTFRVDAPMMKMAAKTKGATLLVYCLPSTEETSTRLLRDAFNACNREPLIELAFCPDAWRHFEAGDTLAFGKAIAEQTRAKLSDEISAVVLAQASMTAALPFLADLNPPVLSPPESAMNQAQAQTASTGSKEV